MNPIFLAGLLAGIFLGAILTIYVMVRASRRKRSLTVRVTDTSGIRPGDCLEVEGEAIRVTRVGSGDVILRKLDS